MAWAVCLNRAAACCGAGVHCGCVADLCPAARSGALIRGAGRVVGGVERLQVSSTAKLGFVFARRGIVPEGSSSYFLPKLVGVGRAMEWVMTGRVFPAPEAEGSGLYNYLLPEVS
eukprot:COSAG01_NODE_10_length_42970_cov_93.010007_47_plen_115_part_00